MIRKVLIVLYKIGIRFLGGRGLHRIWPFGFLHDTLERAARTHRTPESVSVFGNTLHLPVGDTIGLAVWGEEYEPHVVAALRHFLRPGNTFVDVGANIGYFTVLAAALVGPAGRVIAFEPDTENCDLLSRNIAENGYRNVIVVNKAVSDHDGQIDLYRSTHNAGDHTTYDRQRAITRGISRGDLSPRAVYDQHSPHDPRRNTHASAVCLDTYFKESLEPLDFMKIDIQGAEGFAVRGARAIVRRSPGIKIVSEFWPAGMLMAGVSAEEYLQMLLDLGFRFYDLDMRTGKPRSVAPRTLLLTYTPHNNRTGEILCTRKPL